jgi:hypothetical protein
MPNVNWDNAQGSNVVIADGKYLCRVKDVVIKQTKTGKEMWTLWLVIEDEGQSYGKILFHNLVFGESSLWMVKKFYEAATGEEPKGEHDCTPNDLLDAYVIVTKKGNHEYEGKQQPNLIYFESPHGKKIPLEEVPF